MGFGGYVSNSAIERFKWYENVVGKGEYFVPGHKLKKIWRIDSIQHPTPAQQKKIDFMGSGGHFWECECGAKGTFDYRGNLTPAFTHAKHALRNGRAVPYEKPVELKPNKAGDLVPRVKKG